LVFDLILVSNFIIGFLNHFLTLMTVNVHFALHLTFGIPYHCWLFESLWIFICFLMDIIYFLSYGECTPCILDSTRFLFLLS